MVSGFPNRRTIIAGLSALGLMPRAGLAEDFVDLKWEDLLPEGGNSFANTFQGFIDHDGPSMSNQQPESSGVRPELHGQTVRLPGFVVPIDQRGTGVAAFLLVPFVGACIHVPPPPANQLVFVTTETLYESKGLFEPVNVVGELSVSTISTYLADVGYAMTADRVEPYQS